MKKKVFLALVFVLILSLSICSAETTVSETPIMFRGIEWCSNINEVIEELSPYILSKGTIFSDRYVRISVTSKPSVAKSGFEYSPTELTSDFYVAGHLVSDVDVYAAYGVVDGSIVKDAEYSRVYMCEYVFPCQYKNDNTYDDLKNKLCELYGEPISQTNNSSIQGAAWIDIDGNVVKMSKTSSYQNVFVTYIYGGVYDIIAELQSLQYTNDLSSTDGL